MPNETSGDVECPYQRRSRRRSPNHTVCGGGWLVTRHGASDNNVAEGSPARHLRHQHPRRPQLLSLISVTRFLALETRKFFGTERDCPEHQRNFVRVMSSAVGSPSPPPHVRSEIQRRPPEVHHQQSLPKSPWHRTNILVDIVEEIWLSHPDSSRHHTHSLWSTSIERLKTSSTTKPTGAQHASRLGSLLLT